MSDPGLSSRASRRQSINAAIKQLIDEPPKLHRNMDCDPTDDPASEDGLVTWGIQPSFLELLVDMVTPDCLTLETGSGLSTICFAIIGSGHFCVSPSAKEHNRIRHYCSTHHISTERIRFIPMRSHTALPALDMGGRKLDYALIDGSHAFPQPMIDYYYINEHLKIGGFLAVDDLNISSVGILHKFLITEPAYELIKIDSLKTGIYRKIGATDYPLDWGSQKLNSRYPDLSYVSFQVRMREKLRPLERQLRISLRRAPGFRLARSLLRALAGKGN